MPRAQEGEIGRGLRLGVRGRGDRIDDRRMRVGRERADDLHVRLDLGVGLVHDAEHGFAARDQRERGAHVVGHRELLLDRRPRRRASPARSWRTCRPAPTLTSPVAMRPSPTSLARSKPGPIVDIVDLGILRRDQHQPVAEQVDARVVLDDLLLRAVVHPFEVGGGEDVGRRALLDLLGERGACRVARHHLDAGRLQERRVDVVERVLHRGGGEDRDGLVLRRGARTPAAPRRKTAQPEARRTGRRRHHGGSPSCPRAIARAWLSWMSAAAREPPFRALRRARSAPSVAPHPNHPVRAVKPETVRMLSRAPR